MCNFGLSLSIGISPFMRDRLEFSWKAILNLWVINLSLHIDKIHKKMIQFCIVESTKCIQNDFLRKSGFDIICLYGVLWPSQHY